MGRKHAGNALDVAGTQITGDQMLDKLFADERRYILVMDNVVDGGVEVLLLRLSRRRSVTRFSNVLGPRSW